MGSFWNKVKKRKKTLIVIFILAIILIFLFGTKIILYVNFLLGNDIIVRLDVDKEFMTIPHGGGEVIEFGSSVTTNPFCSAMCDSKFVNIGSGDIIDENKFILKPGIPIKKSYRINSPDKGTSVGLYRFSMECRSINGFLCHTSGEPTTRSIFVSANFTLNQNEEILKDDIKGRLYNLTIEDGDLIGRINVTKEAIISLNKTVNVEELYEKILKLESENLAINERINKLIDEFKNEDYTLLSSEVDNLNEDFRNNKNKFVEIENITIETITKYNSLIQDLKNTREKLEIFRTNASEENLAQVFETIIVFNGVVNSFSIYEPIENKSRVVEPVVEKARNINEIFGALSLDLTIAEFNFEKVSMDNYEVFEFNINLEDPLPQCCVFGECKTCCVTDECINKEENFPVVFLHGHAVTESISAEYSLEGFNDLQKKMEEDGYLNAGTITIYTQKETPGSLGLADVPITIRSSYYFDVFKEPENYVVVQRKSENIDTYAVRLKEVIDTILYKTGKKKINLIAFSMGGLVTRRYIQIFGADKIDKVILLGTPNKGITGDVKALCPIIGGELECNDMDEDSLFINKLNKGNFPDIKIYNIIGTGCDMSGENGDGIILEKNARLENGENYVIKGKCKSLVEPLHLDLLKMDEYPEIYETIIKILKDDT